MLILPDGLMIFGSLISPLGKAKNAKTEFSDTEESRHFGKAIWHHIATMCWRSALSLLLLGVNSKFRVFVPLKSSLPKIGFLKVQLSQMLTAPSPIRANEDMSRNETTFSHEVRGQG